MQVIKSSGVTQEFDEQKILDVLIMASEGTSIDYFDLYDQMRPLLVDNMTTSAIQHVAIKRASQLISADEPDYQYIASRLVHFDMRKKIYGQPTPCSFYDLIVKNTEAGMYDKDILKKYTKEDIEFLETHIDHDKDFELTYAGTMQLKEKYLVRDRSTGKLFETPQFAFMLIGMCLHQDEENNRLQHVINLYEAVSNKQISLPTPIMAGVRTPTRQFSSCVVIEGGDSLDSINKTNECIIKYISKRAGIGVNAGMYRAEGSKIGAGEVRHTGVIPFWKTHQASVKSCSQGGVRGGAASLYYPMWHLEYEKLIVLKNNKGIDENRIRHLDYGVQINDLMIERYIKNDYITLFSPHEVEGMYDAYFRDPVEFRRIYEEAEKNPDIRKKRISARDAFSAFMFERANVARIYPFFVDNANNGAFVRQVAPIKQSNLCAEITLPTSDVGSENPEIALCTLSAFVLDSFDSRDQETINRLAEVMVRALDSLLDYQDYPVKEALVAKKRRSLGIGVTNYAAALASEFLTYSDANEFTHELFERLQYALIKASVKLAKEKGPCELYKETRYGQGELPIDWYKKTVDKLVTPELVCDWESLREDLKKYGIRNSTLSALMPCESSSQVSNSTNGIEPPRQAVTAKTSKEGSFNQVVPNIDINKDLYTYAWKMASEEGMKGYLTQMAIMQKFVDQSISANTYYVPSSYPKAKVPMSVMMDDLLYYWYYGGKTLYYHNTQDGNNQDEESDCESCKL
ncbi:ribonucleotide reductase of class Ia (aerobic), alpha subunit [Providencia phage PSTRCR_121]|nr:ribonucleotide reductase of class Ia (aerobic), alpha subunit [Providencia phage PSTRCR_121]